MSDIEEISGFRFDGVIYETRKEAEDEKLRFDVYKAVEKSLDHKVSFGELRLGSVDQLLEILDDNGLEVGFKEDNHDKN